MPPYLGLNSPELLPGGWPANLAGRWPSLNSVRRRRTAAHGRVLGPKLEETSNSDELARLMLGVQGSLLAAYRG